MKDLDIEARVKELGLNAPKVSAQDIENAIDKVTYTTLPSQKAMVCEITLKNGFTTHGLSCVVSKENFNLSIGQQLSLEKAKNKIWELEAYLLQQILFNERQITND